MGLAPSERLEIHNSQLSKDNRRYTDFLYARLQRQGFLLRDCQRMVNRDRNVFAALMVALGDADAMVTGLTRRFAVAFEEVTRVIEPEAGATVFGLTTLVMRSGTVMIADTTVHELPSAEQMVEIAIAAAAHARRMGHEPRVAFLSYSNFGNPHRPSMERVRQAVHLLDQRPVDFEYDGEMSADVALDADLMKSIYPFCRLSGPANLLIMPALHSANISAKLLQKLGGGTIIGPALIGLPKPVQIVQMGSTVSEMVNMAAIAAHDAQR